MWLQEGEVRKAQLQLSRDEVGMRLRISQLSPSQSSLSLQSCTKNISPMTTRKQGSHLSLLMGF